MNLQPHDATPEGKDQSIYVSVLMKRRTKFSKLIIDEIDRALAQHYGFTDEELDFIIKFDIKYRMGREAVGSDV